MVRIQFKKYSCTHRLNGRRPAAIEAVFVTSDGRRRSGGSLCRECAAAWGLEGLRTWAAWHFGQAIAWQPPLGEVEIVFEGAEGALSVEARGVLRGQLERDKQMRAEMHQEVSERAGLRSLPAAELARRVTLVL